MSPSVSPGGTVPDKSIDGLPSSKKMLANGGGVLIMGMPRSETYSVAHAMKMLGHEHVFHNIDVRVMANKVWGNWFHAMWACSLYIREHVGHPYFAKTPLPRPSTRADWDNLVGNYYQVIADMAVYFVPDLIEAYPDAQVILWQRYFEAWRKSYDTGVLREFDFDSPFAMFIRNMGSKDYEGRRKNARDRYREHFETVRKMVKPDKLLEFRLSDGWKPLCEFLDCPIPDEPFRRLNEMDAIKKLGREVNNYVLYLAIWNMAKHLLLLGSGALIMYLATRYLFDMFFAS